MEMERKQFITLKKWSSKKGFELITTVSVQNPPFALSRDLVDTEIYEKDPSVFQNLPRFSFQLDTPVEKLRGNFWGYCKFLFQRKKATKIEEEHGTLYLIPPIQEPTLNDQFMLVAYKSKRPSFDNNNNNNNSSINNIEPKKIIDVPPTIIDTNNNIQPTSTKNVVRKKPVLMSLGTHPNMLTTLAQNHAEWILGGLTELIDNSADANAKKSSC